MTLHFLSVFEQKKGFNDFGDLDEICPLSLNWAGSLHSFQQVTGGCSSSVVCMVKWNSWYVA